MAGKKVNVLVVRPPVDAAGDWGMLPDELMRQIKAVSADIKATQISILADGKPGDEGKEFNDLLAAAEVIWSPQPPKDLVKRAPNLKWVQSPVSGVDSYGHPDIINSGIILTNSSGMHGTQVGELAFAHLIMCAKNAPLIFRQLGEKKHDAFIPVVLEGKTAAVLGLGPIGKTIARFCKAFRMKVLGVEANPKVTCRYTDAIFPASKLHEVLKQSDFVVDALPLLASTRKIIGEKELRIMKPAAFFVNIGRGGTVDQEALTRALEEKWIAGAGLDAINLDPPPAQSKLWTLPNVIITPHVAGRREDYHQLAANIFCKNLGLYLAGKKLKNVVDKKSLAVRA